MKREAYASGDVTVDAVPASVELAVQEPCDVAVLETTMCTESVTNRERERE